MTKEKWVELKELLDSISLDKKHKELKETIDLICESIKLSEELDEINKKLQNKEGK